MCPILEPLADGRLVIVPEDALSGRRVTQFRGELKPILDRARRLIVDLSKTTFMDSAGCSVLLWAHRELKERGGRLILCGVTPPVRALFDLIRLHTVVPIVADRPEALEAAKSS